MRNSFVSPIIEFFKYRELIWYQVKAEFKQKHFQKALGPLWWFLEPLLMSAVFVFFTTILFKQTFGEHQVIIIIMVTLIWRWFSRSLENAPGLLLNFQAELKRTNLPILPLIFSNVITELMFFGFGLIVIIGGALVSGVHVTEYIAYLPLLVLLQFFMTISLVTFFAKYGLLFRDLGQILWMFVQVWFFASPGIYSENLVPVNWQWLYQINPFATIFPAWRNILIYGTSPNLINIGIWFAVFVPLALLGLRSLQKGRGEFYKRL